MATKEVKTKEVKPKRKLKPGMGKVKGNGFESKIAKALTAALPLNFIRSPGSGARVGGVNYEKFGAMFGSEAMKLFVADVVPTNEKDAGYNFLWSLECKAYATSDTFNHMVSGSSKVYKWFDESVVDSAKVGKKPMLLFKWNSTPTYVVVEHSSDLVAQPSFIMTNVQYGKTLAVYLFENVVNIQDFWVEKIE